MHCGERWAHARPSVACSGASTGPTQELILQLEKVIWAHSRHLQYSMPTMGPCGFSQGVRYFCRWVITTTTIPYTTWAHTAYTFSMLTISGGSIAWPGGQFPASYATRKVKAAGLSFSFDGNLLG